MTTDHTFTHEIQWHWVIVGIALGTAVWKLSDPSVVEKTDASKEDVVRVAGQLMTS